MRRILIIEDDETNAALISRRLRQESFSASFAGTFADGLAKDASEEFDCIICDLGLPDPDLSDSFATASRLNEFRAPVVAYTGEGAPAIAKAVRETGASLVVKSSGVEILVEKVWSQINYRHSDRDSQMGQIQAQRKLSEPSIQETTPVSISLNRVFVIVGSIVAGTVTVTSLVLGKLGSVDTSINSIKTTLESSTTESTKRLNAFDDEMKKQATARDERLKDWTRWRWNVAKDIHSLGDATKTPVSTPSE